MKRVNEVLDGTFDGAPSKERKRDDDTLEYIDLPLSIDKYELKNTIFMKVKQHYFPLFKILANEEYKNLFKTLRTYGGIVVERKKVALSKVKEEIEDFYGWLDFEIQNNTNASLISLLKTGKEEFEKYVKNIWYHFYRICNKETSSVFDKDLNSSFEESFDSDMSSSPEGSLPRTPKPHSEFKIETPKETHTLLATVEDFSNGLNLIERPKTVDCVQNIISKKVVENFPKRFTSIQKLNLSKVTQMKTYLTSSDFKRRFPYLYNQMTRDNLYRKCIFRTETELTFFRLQSFMRIFEFFGVKLFFNCKPTSISSNIHPDIFSEEGIVLVVELKVKDVLRFDNFTDFRNMCLVPEEMGVLDCLTLLGDTDHFYAFSQTENDLELHTIKFSEKDGLLDLIAVTLCYLEERTNTRFKDKSEKSFDVMKPLSQLTVSEMIQGFHAQYFSPKDVILNILDRIESSSLENREQLIQLAEESGSKFIKYNFVLTRLGRYINGEALPLDGVPISFHEFFQILDSNQNPPNSDLENSVNIVEKFRNLGSIILGTDKSLELKRIESFQGLGYFIGSDFVNPLFPSNTNSVKIVEMSDSLSLDNVYLNGCSIDDLSLFMNIIGAPSFEQFENELKIGYINSDSNSTSNHTIDNMIKILEQNDINSAEIDCHLQEQDFDLFKNRWCVKCESILEECPQLSKFNNVKNAAENAKDMTGQQLEKLLRLRKQYLHRFKPYDFIIIITSESKLDSDWIPEPFSWMDLSIFAQNIENNVFWQIIGPAKNDRYLLPLAKKIQNIINQRSILSEDKLNQLNQ